MNATLHYVLLTIISMFLLFMDQMDKFVHNFEHKAMQFHIKLHYS